MREFIFRGKRIGNDSWVYGGIIKTYHPNFSDPDCYAICAYGKDIFVEQDTIGQYTGLKDKNGKKIFEGDIVRDMQVYYSHLEYVKHGIETKEHAEKLRENGRVRVVEFCTENIASCGCCYPYFIGTGFKADGVNLKCCEVIGNIFENPELLEEK